MRTELSLEGLELKPEELVPWYHLSLILVKEVAVKTLFAGVVIAFSGFIEKRVIKKLVDIVGFVAFLSKNWITSNLQKHSSEGW